MSQTHTIRFYFNPRSPHGERRRTATHKRRRERFQPTLPARGATLHWCARGASWSNFNPRSPHGERRKLVIQARFVKKDFNPRSPHGERPRPLRGRTALLHISTHAPRTGSDSRRAASRQKEGQFQPTLPARGATATGVSRFTTVPISTHAPRTGSDRYHFFRRLSNVISTHAPRTGSDMRTLFFWRSGSVFQPTLPARGATHAGNDFKSRDGDFNPRSPHGERQRVFHGYPVVHGISTHAPRTGSDRPFATSESPGVGFQPTLPARGATGGGVQHACFVYISTHAPRTGSDVLIEWYFRAVVIISTHAPRTGSDGSQQPADTRE